MHHQNLENIDSANNSMQNISMSLAVSNDSDSGNSDLLYDVPPSIIALLSFFYGAISLVAIIGNFCVLIIVATSRRMRTVTNCFIANLAVADIIIAMFAVPFQFQAALLQRWLLPPFMCAFCPFVQALSVNVSIITLTAIALDRYRAVVYPLKAKTSKLSAKVAIMAIWVFSALAGVPYAIALRVTMVPDAQMGNDTTKPFCMNVHISPVIWKVYNHVLVTLQYFVPLCLISAVYITIAIKLKYSGTPGNTQCERDANIMKNKKKVIKMLILVVLLFALCWLPFQLYNILQEILPEINKYKYINVIWFCCHWLAMSNSCYNPFIYAIYNERFNTEFKNKFKCCMSLFRRRSSGEKATDSSLSSRYG
ncbi:neuromedin-K receptor-like [Argiope bruennichi]|uniref:neuromedin-K receptor-like n=1 Tax=Argiope bruennichi TaxID=94029 RepID=UPI002495953F|nr:neuromedin-K receptor-like [Argiope bruennichi]